MITTAAYSVYINDGSIIDVPIISEEIFNNKEETNIYYDFGTNKDIEIDVELIANYPNQLCYDGKSYAINLRTSYSNCLYLLLLIELVC